MSKKIDRILGVIDEALQNAANQDAVPSDESDNPFERFCTIGRGSDEDGGELSAPAVT